MKARLVILGIFVLALLVISRWIATNNSPLDTGDKTPASTANPGNAPSGEHRTEAVQSTEPPIDTAVEEQAFYFPFMGKVNAHMSIEQVKSVTGDASALVIPFRVFADERGQFLHAEYAQDGTSELEWSPTHIQGAMEASGERVVGFPKTPAPIKWWLVLQKVAKDVPLREVKRINLTYVDYEFEGRSIAPVFIVNVFGYDALPASSFPATPDPKWARTRFLFDAKGELFLMDSCL